MFEKLAHHVVVHMSQHPKETAAAALAVGKAVAPYAIAAIPCVVGVVAIGGIIYGISELVE